jgi:hypothetical protein
MDGFEQCDFLVEVVREFNVRSNARGNSEGKAGRGRVRMAPSSRISSALALEARTRLPHVPVSLVHPA